MTETSYCPKHRDTPTKLRCSRCDALVCPKCMVHSPVGVRCEECGKGTRLPVYDVSGASMTRAVLVSLIIGLLGGVIIAIVIRPLPLGIVLYGAAMAGFGYLMSEGVGVAAGRKRGRALQWVAVGGALLGAATMSVATFAFGGAIGPFDLLGGSLAAYVAYVRLR